MKMKLTTLILALGLGFTLNSASAGTMGEFFSTSAGMDASLMIAGKGSKKSKKSSKSDKSDKSDKSGKSDKSAKSDKSKKSNKSDKSKKSDKNPPVAMTNVCLLDTSTGVYNLATIPLSDLEGYMMQNLIGPLLVRYRDADNDTLGDPNVSIETCSEVVGYIADSSDLDDTFPDFTVD